MADLNNVITLGIGTPSSIEHFILFGLNGVAGSGDTVIVGYGDEVHAHKRSAIVHDARFSALAHSRKTNRSDSRAEVQAVRRKAIEV